MRKLVLVLACTLLACHGSERAAAPSAPHAAAASTRGAPLLAVTVWPERWPRVASALGLASGGDLRFPASPWELAGEGAKQLGLGSLALPPPGLDPKAPVTIEVFALPGRFEETALAALRGAGKASVRAAARIRITAGATDPAQLAAALRAAIAARAPDQVGPPLGLHVVQGASAVALDIILPDGQAPDGGPAVLAEAFPADLPSAARVLVRPDELRQLGPNLGTNEILHALAEVKPDEQVVLLAQGLSELLSGYLLMDPASALSSEARLDLRADPAHGAQLAFALTPAGETTLAAAGLARGATAALGTLSWQKAIAAVPTSPLLDSLMPADQRGSMQAAANVVFQCGGTCMMYLAASPGTALQLLKENAPKDLAELLEPVSGEVAFAAAQQATWTGDLLVLHAPGDALERWQPDPPPRESAAETCYGRALVAVRGGLGSVAELAPADRAAAIGQAKAALDGAASCVSSDPDVAARYHAMTQLLGELTTRRTP